MRFGTCLVNTCESGGLGYTLPRRSLLSTSTATHLGLLSRPMREALPANPFYSDVFHGIEQVCHEFRINLSFSSLDVVNGRLRSLPVTPC